MLSAPSRWRIRASVFRMTCCQVTALLDVNIPIHTVAQRAGDDPAVLMRNYTQRHRTAKADVTLNDAIAGACRWFLEAPTAVGPIWRPNRGLFAARS
jgi:hypothetical protein